jgi:hypothetical protein
VAGIASTVGGLPRTPMLKGKLFGGNPTTATRPRKTRDSAIQT